MKNTSFKHDGAPPRSAGRVFRVLEKNEQCGWAACQIRRAAHLSKVSFLQMVVLVLPLGWPSDSTRWCAEQGAMAGWTSQ